MKDSLKVMAAHAYLGRIGKAERELEQLKTRRSYMQMLLTDTAIHLTETPHTGTADPQREQEIHAEIDSLDREIAEAEIRAMRIKREIGMALYRLTDLNTQEAMMLHYVKRMKWRDVAEKMQYSLQRVYQFRENGIKELASMLAEEKTWEDERLESD